MKLKLQLSAFRALWSAWAWVWTRTDAMAQNEWAWRRRCDGYAPIGADRAQYCFRLASHHGPCLAQIDADHADGPAEFMPDKRAGVDYTGPYSTCRHCHAAIHLLRSPSGEWWAHNRHPADGHDAEPETSWRICPQCGRYTAISHRSRWCAYEGDELGLPHWCCSREECDAVAVRRQAAVVAEQYEMLKPLLMEPEQRYLQGVVPGGYPDEEPGESPRCRCPFVNNPPCANCEDGLVDPDAEVRP